MSAAGATLERTTEKPPGSSRNTILRALGVCAAALLLGLVFRRIDLRSVLELLRGLGPYAGFLILPSVCGVGLEIFAWQNGFSLLGVRPAFWSLARVRIVSESIGVLLPLGALWSDAIKPGLLARECRTATCVNLASVATRKYQLVLSQAAYLALGFALGHRVLEHSFERVLGSGAFAWSALVAAALLALLAESIALSLRGGSALRSVLGFAARLPSERLKHRLAQFQDEAERTDSTATRFFSATFTVRAALAVPCLAGWLLEATETWTILHVLGARLSWGDAVGVEALVVLGRNVLAILPGGLGAQELGYATLLAGAGVDMSVSGALMLLKRAREMSWLVLGSVLFAASSLTAGHFGRTPDVGPSPAE